MFTGIIESVGHLRKVERRGDDIRLTVASAKLDLSDVKLGDSIATNGVCLTVVERLADGYVADISAETVSLTGFAHYAVGTSVNLEKAVTPTTRLGGHMVSGHVDGVGVVVEKAQAGKAWEFWLEADSSISKYIAEKGSITVDGISLTVNDVKDNRFMLTIVPHTSGETTIDTFKVGTQVNLEVDIIARYVERLLTAKTAEQPAQGLTMAKLAESGFLR